MAYDIHSINPEPPKNKPKEEFKVERFALKNQRWSDVVEIIGGVCPSISNKDLEKMTDYDNRFFIGAIASEMHSELRKILLKKHKIKIFPTRNDEIKAEKYHWEDLEKIYEMLCWSDGFRVT